MKWNRQSYFNIDCHGQIHTWNMVLVASKFKEIDSIMTEKETRLMS